MRELELRNISRPVEFRATDTGPGILTGYAAVFNRFSQNLGGFVEQVDPAAFTKSLSDGVPVVARFNHEDNLLLGTTDARTLTLEIDGTGLRYEVQLPDTTAGRDVRVLAERGDLSHSSFAFRTLADDWSFTPEGFPLRTLLAVQLVDVAPVTNPAYRDTTTGLRSLADHLHLGIDLVKEAAEKDELRKLLDNKDPGAHGDGLPEEQRQVDNHRLIPNLRKRLDLLSL
ncbi:HK97 family phage prohead protease [Pseudarthrobacter sp. J64]|uniref:HK97 family phage prohead protease n=1 Tax=Pseudarthrobacter sp. J64 TaxID=3116485 RepID=UPI002E7FF703|nr:HK97 family phage prohead protease [Pseudarthrobacter sp. J64]MEE2568598.1 HK97 family phage prohead protease [Pseudarthrobacter sp. J64]